MLRNIQNIAIVAASLVGIVSCYNPTQKADAENRTTSVGKEYAPQMYHSEAYDPLNQVENKEQGLNYFPFEKVGGGKSDYDAMNEGHGEFYNSNYYNRYGMNMRQPDQNAVARGELPYRLPKDSLAFASNLRPMVSANGSINVTMVTDSVSKYPEFDLGECEELYLRFCSHCHGESGMADGAVGKKFGGVPMYASAAIKDKPIGHIFHVIRRGKGRMGSHASQLSQEESWKIATFVQTLQKQ